MTIEAPNWYKETIRAQVRARNKVMGGYLDGMFTPGDGGAGVIKFPVISGNIDVYELTGSIQNVRPSNPTLNMLQVSVRDFEAAVWMRMQDFRKQGPSEQAAVAKELSKAIRIKRDMLKIDALHAFCEATSPLTDNPKVVQTIGDGTTRIDFLDFLQMKTAIFGTGTEEAVWWAIPHGWHDQLSLIKEYANAEWRGPTDLPLAAKAAVSKKTVHGVHIFTLPDSYFVRGTGKYGTGSNGLAFDEAGYVDTYAWTVEAVGAEMEWNEENMSLTTHADREGSPMLGKVGLSGNAVGLLPEGVKRMRFRAINRPTRPA